MNRFEHIGADPREAAEVYQEAFSGERFTVTPRAEAFSYRYASIGDERLTLRTSTCTGSVAGEVPHLRQYVVSWFRAGSGQVDLQRLTRRGRLAEPFLLPAEQPFGLAFDAHKQNFIHFGQRFLEDVATEVHAGPPQAVAFDLETEADSGMLSAWRSAVSAATSAITHSAAGALVRMNAQLQLARTLLRLFSWRALDVPSVFREAPLAKARVALEYLQHHAHEPITPADAALAAGLHTRSLQLATRRHLGLSPSSYLRNVRLDRVNDELRAADPGTTTVAGVARTWGFGNLGRFSSTYSLRFGEKPNQTLRS